MSTHSLEFSFTAETFNLAGETITAAPVAGGWHATPGDAFEAAKATATA